MFARTVFFGRLMVATIVVLNFCRLDAYRTDEAKLHLQMKDKNTIVKTIQLVDKVLIEEYKITEGPDNRFLLYETGEEEEDQEDEDNDYEGFKQNAGLFIIASSGNFNENATGYKNQDAQSPLESWSVVWYIASFGGLIAFFLVVSCSEWCCRRNATRTCQNTSDSAHQVAPDIPPPSYEQFAPPPYESLMLKNGLEKSEFDVYVVPVDTMSSLMATNEDAPPSYYMASERYKEISMNGDVAVASSSKDSSVVVDVTSLLDSNEGSSTAT